MRSTKGKTAGCALAISAAFMMLPVSVSAADEVWNYRGVADSLTGVVIRTGASEDSGVAGYLETGGTADVISAEGDWYYVVSGDVTGYIKSEYLALGDTAEYLAGVYGHEGVETYWDGVAFFAEPDGNSEIVYEADAYEQFVLLEDQGTWLEVQDEEGTVLYVPAEGVRDTVVMAKATSDGAASGGTGTQSVSNDSGEDAMSYAGDLSYETGSSYELTYTEPAYGDPSYEEPSYTEPAYGDQTYEEPSYTEPAYGDQTYEEPSYTEPAYEDQTYEEPSYTEPAYEEPSYEEPTYTEPSYETEAPADTNTSVSASSSDLDLLAAIIYCEAGNQSREGMVAVGAVVLNRVASSSFPDTISEVIYQSGQFTPASSGTLASALANGVPSACYEAAQAALNGENPVGNALYFNGGSGKGIQIGDHQFY